VLSKFFKIQICMQFKALHKLQNYICDKGKRSQGPKPRSPCEHHSHRYKPNTLYKTASRLSMADSKVFRCTGTCHFYSYLWPCCFIINSLIYGAVFCYGCRATVTRQLSLTSTLPHTNNSDLSH